MQTPPTIESTASALWTAQATHADRSTFGFLAHSEPCFLILLEFNQPNGLQVNTASELLNIAIDEQACISVQGLSGISLWEMAAQAVRLSPCHVYLNLDLLTIDPHAQDWGDFKIKPEQVEVQRNELTHVALFNPRLGFVVQVLKSALPTFMDMLRTADLAQFSFTIGKTWGQVAAGRATLDIYRDAKKQASFSATDVPAAKTMLATEITR